MTAEHEPRDVESRLRASLHAYAEVVDDVPAGRSAIAGDRRGPAWSPVRGWRAPALIAAAVIAVAGGGWFVTAATSPPSPTAAPPEQATVLGGDARGEADPESAADSSPGSSAAATATGGPAGQLMVPPPAEVGVAYPFDLHTHCGILGADVAGVWFAAESPLVEEFGPPAGWDDPYQRGTLTLESTDVAVFTDDAGHELVLRAAESERPPPCA